MQLKGAYTRSLRPHTLSKAPQAWYSSAILRLRHTRSLRPHTLVFQGRIHQECGLKTAAGIERKRRDIAHALLINEPLIYDERILRESINYWRINTGMVLKSDVAHALLPQAADRSMLERLAQVACFLFFFIIFSSRIIFPFKRVIN